MKLSFSLYKYARSVVFPNSLFGWNEICRSKVQQHLGKASDTWAKSEIFL